LGGGGVPFLQALDDGVGGDGPAAKGQEDAGGVEGVEEAVGVATSTQPSPEAALAL